MGQGKKKKKKYLLSSRTFQVVRWQRICMLMQETQEMQVLSLGQEDVLEEEVTIHSSILT